MKRFTETLKWQDPWFRRLSAPAKLLWFYALDHCDNIGLIELDFEFISSDCRIKVTADHAKELGERLQKVDDGKYFIPRFIPFQYGKLSESCRPHEKVIEAVRSHSLISTPRGFLYPLDRVSHTLSGTLPDNAKDKKEEEDKDKTGKGQEKEGLKFPDGYECLAEWVEHKTAKKEKYTERGLKALVSQQTRYPAHFVAASVEKSIVNGWQGLFTEKITESDAAPFLPKQTVQWAEEPDFYGMMLAKQKQKEDEERAQAGNPPEEEGDDNGDFS